MAPTMCCANIATINAARPLIVASCRCRVVVLCNPTGYRIGTMDGHTGERYRGDEQLASVGLIV